MIPVETNERVSLLLNQNWFPVAPITARAAYTGFRRGALLGLDRNKTPFEHDAWYNYAQDPDGEHDLTPVAFHPDQPCLRSQHHIWPVPSVVVINPVVFYKHARMTTRRGKPNKWLLCKKEKFRCKLCGDRFAYNQLTIDHVVPRGQGGPDDAATNWTVMCQPCNNRKGDRMDIKDWKGRPVRPTFVPGWFIQIEDHEYRDEWEPHLLGMKP